MEQQLLHNPNGNGTSNCEMFMDGNSITVESLMAIDSTTQINLTEEAWEAVRKSRKIVDRIIEENKIVYGINTGFGFFANVVIMSNELSLLQENIIRSHAAGVGSPMSQERTKRMLALRINVLAKGYSGVSEETLSRMIAFFNKNCIPKVPEQGSLGASGDLAPLSHLALGMLGEGEMWNPKTGQLDSASKVIEAAGLKRLALRPKEGLALINGTTQIATLGAEAVWRAENLAISADAIAAISLEVLHGTVTAYFPEIHRPRSHSGQRKSARTMRSLLHSSVYPSEIAIGHSNCSRVQDAYSLRCAPQVHGVAYDTIAFVRNIIETEMNSATDNPMVFSDTGKIRSGGNFHGEYPSKALDFLAIAVHELANISERRIERLMNGTLSGLPAFLVTAGGLNSGFMVPHCTAAALVSENKTLAHPASVDSISTSAATEDHVSMGAWAARKCLQVVANVETVLGIEYLAATQGLSLRRPLKASEPVEALYSLIREEGRVSPLGNDRFMSPDMEAARRLISDRLVAQVVEPYLKHWATLDPNDNYEYQE